MPDHSHGVVSPKYENLSKVLGDFKSYTTKIAWKFGIIGKLWQRSFYDHIARREEDLLSIYQYILANPVRKVLVEVVEDWPYGDFLGRAQSPALHSLICNYGPCTKQFSKKPTPIREG